MSGFSLSPRGSDVSNVTPPITSYHFEYDDPDDPGTPDDGEDGSIFYRRNENGDLNELEIVLCVYWNDGQLGAAAYYSETAEVHVLCDVDDIPPYYTVLKRLLYQIQPTLIVSCKYAPRDFIGMLRRFIRGDDCEDITEVRTISTVETDEMYDGTLVLYPKKDFKYEICCNRIYTMRLLPEPKDVDEESHISYVNSLINMTNEAMTASLGALLLAVDKTMTQCMLGLPSRNLAGIRVISLENMVWMEDDTLKALDVFNSKPHPSSYKWTSASQKEGYSIFMLMNRCHSKLGWDRMRILMRHPTKDITVLQRRQEMVDFFMNSANDHIAKNIINSIQKMRNINGVWMHIVNTTATPLHWKTFYKTMCNAAVVAEICQAYRKSTAMFADIASCLEDGGIFAMSQAIHNLMDFEESRSLGRFVVKSGVIEELDRLKDRFVKLPSIMEKVAEQELHSLPREIEKCWIVYVPEIGYLLAVPLWAKDLDDDSIQIPGLVFRFRTDEVAHYKSPRCAEMDEMLGDCQTVVMKQELEIMTQVAENVRQHVRTLLKMIDKIIELDCLLSFAIVAKELNLTRPNLVEERVVNIKEGWHMMQKLKGSAFISNDYFSMANEKPCKIITGPNSSGKTVYIKQVAVIAYLAHIGSFVPATSATIGILDFIYAQIHSTESSSIQASAFAEDLRQLHNCTSFSSPSSLIVLDEFGKGTIDVDGLAILAACLKYFCAKGDECPHVLISTHFHMLPKLLPDMTLVHRQTMDFMIEGNEVVYLYRVKDGFLTMKLSNDIAEAYGIDKDIIRRAEQVLEAMTMQSELEETRKGKYKKKRKDFFDMLSTLKVQTASDIRKLIQELNQLSNWESNFPQPQFQVEVSDPEMFSSDAEISDMEMLVPIVEITTPKT